MKCCEQVILYYGTGLTVQQKAKVMLFVCINECYCNMDILLYMSPNVLK